MPRILVRHIRAKRNPFDFPAFKREFEEEFNQNIRPDVLSDFKKTQSGWEHPVTFASRLTIKINRITLVVFPSGINKEQWKLVSAGSPVHDIPARKPGGSLSFRSGYVAATQLGRIQSRGKFRFGKLVATKLIKDHPGFQGRNFPKLIADKHDPEFKRKTRNALRRATRRFNR